MDFKKQVKDEKIWASEKEIQNVPDIIKKEYELLRESIQKDDICGALFRLKDIYEISMKLPSIIAIISISSYVEDDNDFIRMTSDELKKEHEEYLSEKKATNIESEVLKKFGIVLSRLLREPLSIGSWKELVEIIVEHSAVFEVDDNLNAILARTIKLHSVKPKKVNGENGRYEDVSNWRNKTIGHGTLLINTEDYWEQAYDLVKGLYDYFSSDENGVSLADLYSHIVIERDDSNARDRLIIGEKEYSVFEYIYSLNNEQYFFDSYYSRQDYTEITNYVSAPKRLKNNTYYKTLYSLFDATKKGKSKKRGRQITNSADREMYACLNCIPSYEKPTFVIDEIKKFINENDKGILYIQMERGMGKSTLAHRLDGRYQKGFLQKDLTAVVRVYHISDMQLRNENRVRDYFTALNTNLISYEGGQLEIDNDEYFVDGKDLRQLMEGDDKDASLSFCQYLQLFRLRYEEEIEDDDIEEINLIYIIDGIDELNSDTFSILKSIPDGRDMQGISEEVMNHVFIILLSRTKDEDNLPAIAKESIEICEKKANKVLKIDSDNESYYQLLKKYINRNYKQISEEKACEIIEKAQRKFLYIQPYMAMGEIVVKSDKKASAYDVARNYIEELQKLYCGTSLHTLQLIVSSIAVFHNISLKEICNLILFTKVSYDVIGVLNDILPLLTTKRTDGDDMYSFANEEYEKFVYESMINSVFEVICRYRISLSSWLEKVDKKADSYGKEWGDYVRRALVTDAVAKKIGFNETTEEYVKSLINLWSGDDPRTFYSREVGEELSCNMITQIRQLGYKKLEILTVKDLSRVELMFRNRDDWHRLSHKLMYEYTQEIINHCLKKGEIDEWFDLIIYCRIGLRYDSESESEKYRLAAFRSIVKQWENQSPVVNYICKLVEVDIADERVNSYGIYLEQLLLVIQDESLRSKIFEGLLSSYVLFADGILRNPRTIEMDSGRKEIMLKYLQEAEEYKEIANYHLISKIKSAVFNENTYDEAIRNLEVLADKVFNMRPEDYSQELIRYNLNEENLSEEQLKNFRNAQVKNYRNIMELMKGIFTGENADEILPWLNACCNGNGNVNCFTKENKDLLIDYLDIFDAVTMIYVEEGNIKNIYKLAWGFKVFLKRYDENIRQNCTGLYRNYYWDRVIDSKQALTSWEKTYALYCSTMNEIGTCDINDDIPVIVDVFVGKYLQELFENGEIEKYDSLNSKIHQGYNMIDFRDKYIFECGYPQDRIILQYYRWISVRYYRSMEGSDEMESNYLYEWLKEEYELLFNYVMMLISNETDLIHKGNMLSRIMKFSTILLCLSKMIPDTISSIDKTKAEVLLALDELIEKSASKGETGGLVEKIKEKVNDSSEWCNTDVEFVVDTSDRSMFETY